MTHVLERSTMAKRKGRPANAGGEGVPVRLDADLVSKARYLCAQSGESMTSYFSAILRPKVEKDFRQAAKPLLESDDAGAK